jgi:hypothetical protein
VFGDELPQRRVDAGLPATAAGLEVVNDFG